MSEVSKKLICILMRSGVEIWLEQERAEAFKAMLGVPNAPQFIQIGDSGNMVNRADVTGIFTPQAMGGLTRRKNGQWQCDSGMWHERKDKCECGFRKRQELYCEYHGFYDCKVCDV